MKTLILAASALALAATAASADTVITKETESGVYSAPVAGATPQARENPAPGTSMGETRETTTVRERPNTTVVVPSPGPTVVEPGERVIEIR